jgi:APA family basic amino acid/polyamine antiporter
LAEKKTFPRNMSGLVRGIGPITAAMVTIAITVGWGWQVRVFQFTGYTPLPENLWFAGIAPPVMSFIICGIIILVIMLGYTVLTTAMPRSGGGYVVISRILGPFAGFISAWFELYAIAIYIGELAVLVFEQSFYFIGPAIGVTAVPVSYNGIGFFAGGIFLVVLFTAIVALGVRVTGYVLQLLVWVPAALGLYVLYLLGVAIVNPATLQNGISMWGQLHGIAGVTAEAYVQAALAQGLDAASVGNYWTAVSASLLGAYFAYVGYASTTFVAGEVKDPSRNLPRVLLIAPFIVIVMFVAMASFGAYAAAAVGQITLPNGNKWSFFEAYSYLYYGGGNPQQAKLPNFGANIATLASMVGMGLGLGSLNILLLLFAVLWVVNDLPAFILVASRIIFAMSFDRLLPSSLSKVSGRFNSPVYATVMVGMFAVLGVLGETCIVCNGGSWYIGGIAGSIVNNIFVDGVFSTDLLDAVFFSLFSLAVLLFPFRLKRSFDAAPFRPGGILGVMAIGLSGLTANFIITWVILTSPRGDVYNILSPTSDNLYALGFDALLGVIGCLIYAWYRFGLSRKEVDYSVIFSTIPPE